MRRPQLQSTFARAVVPVLAGIAVFAVLGLGLWGAAAIMSDGGSANDDFSGEYQDMGSTTAFANAIADGGPIVLPDLVGDDRHIVLDHTGDDPDQGWAIYLAHPADRDAACQIEQVKGTRTFTDCEGRVLQVDDLALPPAGVRPIIDTDAHFLTLDLSVTSDPGDPLGTSGG